MLSLLLQLKASMSANHVVVNAQSQTCCACTVQLHNTRVMNLNTLFGLYNRSLSMSVGF